MAAVARNMAGVMTKEYGVVRPTLHGKRVLQRGERIVLTPEQAKHLLETKAIGIISEEPVFLVDGEPLLPTPTPKTIYALSGDDSMDLNPNVVVA